MQDVEILADLVANQYTEADLDEDRQTLRNLIGILDEVTTLGLIDLPSAIARLQQTSFRASPNLQLQYEEAALPESRSSSSFAKPKSSKTTLRRKKSIRNCFFASFWLWFFFLIESR